jgi:hypothetical protein
MSAIEFPKAINLSDSSVGDSNVLLPSKRNIRDVSAFPSFISVPHFDLFVGNYVGDKVKCDQVPDLEESLEMKVSRVDNEKGLLHVANDGTGSVVCFSLSNHQQRSKETVFSLESGKFAFESQMVLQQLRARSVFETIRISCAGYPSRSKFTEYADRYNLLAHSKDWDGKGNPKVPESILANIKSEDKVFFRDGQVNNWFNLV